MDPTEHYAKWHVTLEEHFVFIWRFKVLEAAHLEQNSWTETLRASQITFSLQANTAFFFLIAKLLILM